MKPKISTSSSDDLMSPVQLNPVPTELGAGSRPVPHVLMEQIERAAPLFQHPEGRAEDRYPGIVRLALLIGAPLLLWAVVFRLVGLLIAPN